MRRVWIKLLLTVRVFAALFAVVLYAVTSGIS